MLRMRAARWLLVVGVALLSAPILQAAPVDPKPHVHTSGGRATVAFRHGHLPDAPVGSRWEGMRVERRIAQLGLLVVATDDLDNARQAQARHAEATYAADTLRITTQGTPNDPQYANQYAPALMGLPAAWGATGWGSSAVTVAVIDSGIDASHPDLAGPRLLAGHDYVADDATPDDSCGHGTQVAGLVAATTGNGAGIAGITQARLLPLKVVARQADGTCGGLSDAVAQAIADATDAGAQVVTMSLSASADDPALAAAVRYAAQHGVLVVAGAGNGNGGPVTYPAAYPEAIAVSAVDASRTFASYSSAGAKVEVAAPGTAVLSTAVGGGYKSGTGTSFAAPQAAGVLALALGCAPAQTSAAQLRTALDETAQDLGPAGRDAQYGFGLVRADRLVTRICGLTATQHPPAAALTLATSSLTVTADASGSSDADGDVLGFAWQFGDGGSASGRTVTHTYATAGTFTVALTVSDGHSTSTASAVAVVAAAAWQPSFKPSSGANEWWIDVTVTASPAPVAVSASVDNGTWVALPKDNWGTWAKSFFVAHGTPIRFRATDSQGHVAVSSSMPWLGAVASSSTLSATFKPASGSNDWWVEVGVTATQPLAKVEARVGSAGNWTNLPKDNWGTWAKSLHVVSGAPVVFRATSTTGQTATSAAFTWP